VVSPRKPLLEPKASEKRPESLQLAAPQPIKEMAINCGHRAARRDARMVTRWYAINNRQRINNVAVNRTFKEGRESLI
jgi:hypothetical protein